MVWLQYDDPTIYATYRGRYALLRWIRQSEEFRRKVRILVNKTTHIWPEEAEVLGGLHVSDSDAIDHFTIRVTTDAVYKIHVHAWEDDVYESK
ncbi:hypothetical protein EIP86_003282 [Pleurotus ostreatoroseus]|nr:hypothetical protein EIP86_003282 [Pleurotus ostreatoroseus]